MRRFEVSLAPRLEDDVEKHVAHLRSLETKGEISAGYSGVWYATFEETLARLQVSAERHPYAPEREDAIVMYPTLSFSPTGYYIS